MVAVQDRSRLRDYLTVDRLAGFFPCPGLADAGLPDEAAVVHLDSAGVVHLGWADAVPGTVGAALVLADAIPRCPAVGAGPGRVVAFRHLVAVGCRGSELGDGLEASRDPVDACPPEAGAAAGSAAGAAVGEA